MLGIIIGVGAVVLITALGKGAKSYILGSVADFGSNLIYIDPGSPDQGLLGIITTPDRIKYRDYQALKRQNFVSDVTPFLIYEANVVVKDKTEKKQIVGTTKGYSKAFNFYAAKGRFINDSDVNSATRIAVLGKKVSKKLFGNLDPIGKNIKIRNQTFTVVGVMEKQGGDISGSYDEIVFVPITTMKNYIFGVDYVQEIVVRAIGNVNDTIIRLRQTMRNLHHINNPQGDLSKDDFNILSQGQVLGIFNQVAGILTLFIVAIASISLIVGGIGIMNIMFVAVNQRTREIGLRKAIGATSNDIILQFLSEAILITFFGGIFGAVVGIGLDYVITFILGFFLQDWKFLIDFQALIISLVVCIFIGIIFGLWPAIVASKKNPIEALRYE